MMKHFLYCSLIVLMSCDQPTKIKAPIDVDRTKIAILPIPKTKSFTCPLSNERASHLSELELQDAERILIQCFNENKEIADSSLLKTYTRQYIPYLNDKGEKLIWISCFCNEAGYFTKWKTELAETVLVSDGGDCFITVVINLSTQTYSNFRTHGYA